MTEVKIDAKSNSSKRHVYVRGALNEQLTDAFEDIDSTFDEISADYIVVFE